MSTAEQQQAMTSQRMAGMLAAIVVCCLLAAPAEAGVMFLTDVGGRADSGMLPAQNQLPDNSPVEHRRDPFRLPGHLVIADSGTTSSGSTSSGSVPSSTSNTALPWAACELRSPELVSALQGDRALFFQPSPVFELLDPPKA